MVLAVVNYDLQYHNTKGVHNPNPSQYNVLAPTTLLQPLSDAICYRFVGWFGTQTGGTQVAEIPLGSTGDKDLYAHWQRVEHALTCHGNTKADRPPSVFPVPSGSGPANAHGSPAVSLPGLITALSAGISSRAEKNRAFGPMPLR